MFPTRFSLAEILVLAGTASAGRMTPPASTRISARLKRVQGPTHFTREDSWFLLSAGDKVDLKSSSIVGNMIGLNFVSQHTLKTRTGYGEYEDHFAYFAIAGNDEGSSRGDVSLLGTT